MKPLSFLSLYEKLESLVQRLPEPLQQPILKEITPIKTLFLLQRAPKIVLLGQSGAGKVEIVNALFGSQVAQPGEENLSDGSWR
jgi:predicted GTPase